MWKYRVDVYADGDDEPVFIARYKKAEHADHFAKRAEAKGYTCIITEINED